MKTRLKLGGDRKTVQTWSLPRTVVRLSQSLYKPIKHKEKLQT